MARSTAAFTLLSLSLQTVLAQRYQLIQNYNASNFFDSFNFFSGSDPTGGFVDYVPFNTAISSGLARNASDLVYLGVDSTHAYTPSGPGRPSVRLESKMSFTEGLFAIDLTHMPVGCGTWPAFWTTGLNDWPNDGEIDIIENVNDARINNVALHATGECSVAASTVQRGTVVDTDCNIGHDGNQGCGTAFTEPHNYGTDFNSNGGGLYVMEWTPTVINIWFFTHDNVPGALTDSGLVPDPTTFGTPSASFAGPCSGAFPEKFFNHSIVIDTTFCGGWAGGSFGQGDSSCPVKPGSTPLQSCIDYVANNPAAFKDAWWGIKSLKVWAKVPGFTTNDSNQKPAVTTTVNVSLPTTKGTDGPLGVSPLTGGALDLGQGDVIISKPLVSNSTRVESSTRRSLSSSTARSGPTPANVAPSKINTLPLLLSVKSSSRIAIIPTSRRTTTVSSDTTSSTESPSWHDWSKYPLRTTSTDGEVKPSGSENYKPITVEDYIPGQGPMVPGSSKPLDWATFDSDANPLSDSSGNGKSDISPEELASEPRVPGTDLPANPDDWTPGPVVPNLETFPTIIPNKKIPLRILAQPLVGSGNPAPNGNTEIVPPHILDSIHSSPETPSDAEIPRSDNSNEDILLPANALSLLDDPLPDPFFAGPSGVVKVSLSGSLSASIGLGTEAPEETDIGPVGSEPTELFTTPSLPTPSPPPITVPGEMDFAPVADEIAVPYLPSPPPPVVVAPEDTDIGPVGEPAGLLVAPSFHSPPPPAIMYPGETEIGPVGGEPAGILAAPTFHIPPPPLPIFDDTTILSDVPVPSEPPYVDGIQSDKPYNNIPYGDDVLSNFNNYRPVFDSSPSPLPDSTYEPSYSWDNIVWRRSLVPPTVDTLPPTATLDAGNELPLDKDPLVDSTNGRVPDIPLDLSPSSISDIIDILKTALDDTEAVPSSTSDIPVGIITPGPAGGALTPDSFDSPSAPSGLSSPSPSSVLNTPLTLRAPQLSPVNMGDDESAFIEQQLYSVCPVLNTERDPVEQFIDNLNDPNTSFDESLDQFNNTISTYISALENCVHRVEPYAMKLKHVEDTKSDGRNYIRQSSDDETINTTEDSDPNAGSIHTFDEPAINESVDGEPVNYASLYSTPFDDEPFHDESVDDEPVNNASLYSTPFDDEPFHDESVDDEPVNYASLYSAPVYGGSTYDEPVYDEPVYDEPVYDEPAYELYDTKPHEPLYTVTDVSDPSGNMSLYLLDVPKIDGMLKTLSKSFLQKLYDGIKTDYIESGEANYNPDQLRKMVIIIQSLQKALSEMTPTTPQTGFAPDNNGESAASASKKIPTFAPINAPIDAPTDTSTDAPTDVSTDAPTDVSSTIGKRQTPDEALDAYVKDKEAEKLSKWWYGVLNKKQRDVLRTRFVENDQASSSSSSLREACTVAPVSATPEPTKLAPPLPQNDTHEIAQLNQKISQVKDIIQSLLTKPQTGALFPPGAPIRRHARAFNIDAPEVQEDQLVPRITSTHMPPSARSLAALSCSHIGIPSNSSIPKPVGVTSNKPVTVASPALPIAPQPQFLSTASVSRSTPASDTTTPLEDIPETSESTTVSGIKSLPTLDPFGQTYPDIPDDLGERVGPDMESMFEELPDTSESEISKEIEGLKPLDPFEMLDQVPDGDENKGEETDVNGIPMHADENADSEQ